MLKQNINKLETTTFFNLKFMNSYGISKRTSAISTNLKLSLKIYLNRNTINNYAGTLGSTEATIIESMKKEIRDYVRTLVDNANNNSEIILSKIIMAVQGAYIEYIHHVDFIGLNGTFNQYIRFMDNETDNTSPLEYLTVDNGYLEDNIIFELI